ncbi:MAG: hypothetical protein KF819_00910 [Labilithrix sp.]|nr:hypothetical protein [Labilithrix sp.]
MRPSLSLAAALAIAAIVAPACAELKRAEDAPAAPGEDAGALDGGDADPGDGGGTDAIAPPPPDSECPDLDNAWTKATKARAECASRHVKIVQAAAPIDPTGISIARTPSGRVGIVFNDEIDGVSGEMHLVHFVPSTPTFSIPPIIKRVKGPYDHAGFATKIAATGPDTLHVIAHDVDDATLSGEVVLLRLTGGAEPLSSPEVVVTGVARPTELGLAVDAAGNTFVTVRVATGATTAKLSARKKPAGGAFELLPDVTTTLLPAQAPGAGASSLIVDPSGQVHLLYHHNEVMQHSNPRYHTLDATVWSYRKTIDNAVIDGLSGFSPRLSVFGNKKFAVFYFRKALQTDPRADLRLATWQSSSDMPQIEIVDQGIPAEEPMLYPAYRVAMDVDKFGLVHLAILTPSPRRSIGYLEYRRQTRDGGGAIKWLSDMVDPDVLSELSTAFVDLVVDENARPHIAYRSGKDGRVRYASRYDR